MTQKEFENETSAVVKRLMKHFKCKGNSVIDFKWSVPITYRYYDEEYQCPCNKTDDAYGIELLGTDDFEVMLSNGVVHSSDIEDGYMKDFINKVMFIDFYTKKGVIAEVDGTVDMQDVFKAIVAILGDN